MAFSTTLTILPGPAEASLYLSPHFLSIPLHTPELTELLGLAARYQIEIIVAPVPGCGEVEGKIVIQVPKDTLNLRW